MTFGERIKKLREERGLSRLDLVMKLKDVKGFAPFAILRMEDQDKWIPNMVQLDSLFDALMATTSEREELIGLAKEHLRRKAIKDPREALESLDPSRQVHATSDEVTTTTDTIKAA